MKGKKINYLILFIVSLLSIVGCNRKQPTVEKTPTIEVAEKAITIEVGETQELKYNVLNCDNQNLIKISYDSEIISINDGYVQALKVGKTSIIISIDGYPVSETVDVTVTEKKSLRIIGETNVYINEKLQLDYEIIGIDGKIEWSVENDDIATISKNGLVTPLKIGETTIHAKIGTLEATHKIVIMEEKTLQILGEKMVYVNNTLQLSYQSTGITGAVEWTTSNPSIATVSSNGLVNALAAGEVTIYAKLGDLQANYTIIVQEAPTLQIIGPNSMYVNRELQLSYQMMGAIGTIEWTSSDPSIATVSSNGLVNALSIGEVTIYAKLGNLQASHTIIVQEAPTLQIIGSDSMYTNSELQLNYQSTGITGAVEWRSSDPSIATVSSNGLVNALAAGEVTIYAKLGNLQASHTITIQEAPTLQILGLDSMYVNHELQLSYKSTGITGTIEWTSSDPSIATVSNNGLVNALSIGEVTIYAKLGNLQASHTITVQEAPTLQIIGPDSMYTNSELQLSYKSTGITGTVEWESSNQNIAIISNTGLLTALQEGEVTIYAKIGDIITEHHITIKKEVLTGPVKFHFAGGASEELYRKSTSIANVNITSFNNAGGSFWGNEGYKTNIYFYDKASYVGAAFSDRVYIKINEYTGFYEIVDVVLSGPSAKFPEDADYAIVISASCSGYKNIHNTCFTKLKKNQVLIIDGDITTATPSNQISIHFYEPIQDDTQIEVEREEITKLYEPTKLGCNFLGWYTNENQKIESLQDLSTTSEVFAKWEEIRPVEYIVVENEVSELVTNQEWNLNAHVYPVDAFFTDMQYSSTNTDILQINDAGVIKTINSGVAKIIMTDYTGRIKKEVEITVYPIESLDIVVDKDFTGNLDLYESVKLYPRLYGKNIENISYTFESTNENVLIVDADGVVTAVGYGDAEIITTAHLAGQSYSLSITMNVLEFNLNSRVDQVLKLLIENNMALVEVGNVSLFNDYTTRYYKPSYGSVNRYLFEQLFIDETYIKSFPAPDGVMILEREDGENWEFVTVHDTATLTGTVEAIIASSKSSIHYAVGDGKVYRGTPEQYIGGHAGDGYVPNSFEWIPTGVAATNDAYPVFDMVKKGDKYYYTVNGYETNIEVPTEGTRVIENPSKEYFTHLGPTWKVVDGEYYMGKTWACFTQVYNGAISSLGGNRNSIGIETCVNATGDVYDTWQRTAMLVSDILIRNNLDVTRVKMHNTFSGKDCPQALIAGGFWWDFIEMVAVNYELMKNYSDVVIEFKSHNPEILSDNGHINYENAPQTTTVVTYDITVTIGGESRTVTLSSIVKGTTCWEQWEGKYASSKVWNDGVLQLDGDEETPKHSVKFLDKDGKVINEQFVYDGKDAVLIDPPKVSGYEFLNWNKDYQHITEDTVIQAVYQQTGEAINQYLVQFYDQNGILLKEEYVYEGENATEPIVNVPSGYKYAGWDKDFTNVKENLVVQLVLRSVDYSIVYYDGNLKLNLEPSSYSAAVNESIVLPDGPEKEGYTFVGWFENNQKVVTFFTSDACNKVFYAKYEEIPMGFRIPSDMTFMFTGIKKTPHSSGNGTFVYQPVLSGIDKNGNDYTLPSTSVLKWKWSSLNPEVATISTYSSITTVSLGYAILKAVYVDDESIIGYVVIKTTSEGVVLSTIEEANKKESVSVTFKGMNGEIIDVQEIEKGGTAVIPTIPIYDGYAFIGWDKKHYGIEENTTITAQYVKGNNPFTNKTVSILGDSISTFSGYIPDGYAAFYPYATADLVDVNQTWWMQVINSLGMKLLKNNSYSGTYVVPSSNSTSSDARLQNLLDGNQIPDVIIIYMGTNDCGTSSVDKTRFLEAYKTMLEKIKALCPNSEIYLMTLTPSGLCEASKRDEFNQVIKENSANYHLIDVSNVYTYDEYRNYVVDACHPNKAGMDILAKKIIEELLKGLTN